jgi:Fur family transcriptional regulator, peroxide stress response regulator
MKRNNSIRREKILETLRTTKMHPTAEWVYEQVKMDIPDLSLGTVYRNLKILAEEDRVRVIHSDEGKDHFDGFVEPHHHLICRKCGKVLDYHADENLDLLEQIQEETGFVADSEGIKITGLCENCLRSKS